MYMKLIISDKQKKEQFLAIFQVLKGCTNIVTIIFNDNHIYIQGMDKSHVCLFDMKIMDAWFDKYEFCNDDNKSISFDSSTLHAILGIAKDGQDISIFYEGDADKLNIELVSVSSINYNKYFSIPLTEFESDILEVPDTDYDAEFSIEAKKICEITSQMITFGADLRINCSDEKVNLSTEGELGDMLVTIPIDDLNEYSIAEDETIDLLYSLTFVHKMCLTTKLSTDVNISISKDYPMKIAYDLGAGSQLLFYLAPKIQ
jgi:proliferating cell nuclear antigen PCNA